MEENKYPPTVREISKGINLNSASTILRYLDQLEAAALIKRVPGAPRAIVIKSDHSLEDELQRLREQNEQLLARLEGANA
ncbi:hypothetical protein [Paenibacillus sp. CF384]|uniref:LexA family protein n=1 Tax=Paenibacillus sp. CF384 TaxID=1884382 RepID=UPI000B850A30